MQHELTTWPGRNWIGMNWIDCEWPKRTFWEEGRLSANDAVATVRLDPIVLQAQNLNCLVPWPVSTPRPRLSQLLTQALHALVPEFVVWKVKFLEPAGWCHPCFSPLSLSPHAKAHMPLPNLRALRGRSAPLVMIQMAQLRVHEPSHPACTLFPHKGSVLSSCFAPGREPNLGKESTTTRVERGRGRGKRNSLTHHVF